MLLTNSDLSEQVTAIRKQHFRAKCGHSEEATVESHVLRGVSQPSPDSLANHRVSSQWCGLKHQFIYVMRRLGCIDGVLLYFSMSEKAGHASICPAAHGTPLHVPWGHFLCFLMLSVTSLSAQSVTLSLGSGLLILVIMGALFPVTGKKPNL